MPQTAQRLQVVLSSRNKKKIGEIRELLAPYQIPLLGVDEFPNIGDVVEDGDSFAANAEKKAVEVAQQLQMWTIAEDSGLCVESLNGAPGIYSARFAGEPSSDSANNAKLLTELQGKPPEQRRAYYLCHAVLSNPDGQIVARGEGRCYGQILTEYRGANGFGYDPLFLVPEYHQTFGELAPAVKRYLSHRARAFEILIPKVVAILPR